MTRVCTSCSHPERTLIDQAIVAGTPLRAIAGQFQLSKSSIARHKDEHLPQMIIKAAEQQNLNDAINVVGQLRLINAITLTILTEARLEGNHQTQLKAIDRIIRQLELEARFVSNRAQETNANEDSVRAYVFRLMAKVNVALAAYPEARKAIANALAPPSIQGDHARYDDRSVR